MLRAVGETSKKLLKKKKKENLDNIISMYQLFLAAGDRKQEALVPLSPRLFQKHMKTWRLKAVAARTWREAEGTKAVSHLNYPSLDKKQDGNNTRTCRVSAMHVRMLLSASLFICSRSATGCDLSFALFCFLTLQDIKQNLESSHFRAAQHLALFSA